MFNSILYFSSVNKIWFLLLKEIYFIKELIKREGFKQNTPSDIWKHLQLTVGNK